MVAAPVRPELVFTGNLLLAFKNAAIVLDSSTAVYRPGRGVEGNWRLVGPDTNHRSGRHATDGASSSHSAPVLTQTLKAVRSGNRQRRAERAAHANSASPCLVEGLSRLGPPYHPRARSCTSAPESRRSGQRPRRRRPQTPASGSRRYGLPESRPAAVPPRRRCRSR